MARVLLKPVVTEQSLHEAAGGWFTFAVASEASKPVIKQAVEQQFGVSVHAVRTITIKRKSKRTGRRRTAVVQSPTKKALVKLGKDQKIDLFEVST